MRIFLVLNIIFAWLFFSFSPTQKKITLQKNDAKILIRVLKAKEGILDLHTSQDSLENGFQYLLTEMETEQSYMEMFKKMTKTVAKVQCGHTQLYPSMRVMKEWVLKRKSLPFDYILIGKKLFVVKTIKEEERLLNLNIPKSKQKKLTPNTEIISID